MTDPMQELKEQAIWFLYRLIPKADGRLDKVPFSAKGGVTGTSDKYSGTWVTFAEAELERAKHGKDVGLGFKIPAGYFFLDIDGKDLNSLYVKQRLDRFASYAERSVSGKGIHIYGKYDLSQIPHYQDKNGKLKLDRAYYMKHPHDGIELYLGELTNRFAAYTGDVVNDAPLRDCTEAILLTLDKDMRRKPKTRQSITNQEDAEIIDIVATLRKQKNAKKFITLYDEGDITGYNSQSEAEAALCSLIAFRTGDDPELIDKVFRQSALMRDKWNRDDYREATIQFAIDSQNGEFHASKMPHPSFIKFDQKTFQPSVSVPLLAKYFREQIPYILVRDFSTGSTMKYVYQDGVYTLFSDDMMRGVIKTLIANYNEELVRMGQVNECLQHIATDLNTYTFDELNFDENLINFENGLLRLTDLELLPHTPEVLSTIQIPCKWNGYVTPTPVFDGYLETLTDGDNEIQDLLFEFIGACLSNIKGWRMKKSLWMVGPGNTGKSVLKTLVEQILGSHNFIGIDLSEIEARFGTGAIYGKRLAGSSDMSFITIKELETFKKCTGGDSLFAEFKAQSPFQFTYNGLLWFCMNRLPRFSGDDGQWVYDRIMEVICKNIIPLEKQDKTLIDKMYEEREGIVYKAVMAVQGLIQNGYTFTEPESVLIARQNYREQNSTVISFFNECMCPREDGKITDLVTTGKVYKAYRAWCRDNNNGYGKTIREFREELAAHLGREHVDLVKRQKGNSYYADHTLTEEAQRLYLNSYIPEDPEDDFLM